MQTTITELPEYIKRSESLLGDRERRDIIDYLSVHPKSGDLMEGLQLLLILCYCMYIHSNILV
ncbi:hypothetical protein FJM67_13580 [Maribrevibacterium harenarium]|uniref:Uncharacterized protein n=1 Tax=Maribrevibacterium harenarium TaxID=2589817 RepID=A0A501WII8_9GAMM|nr:hypothetical protein FJM67_13580 [Maribrevibacterium harenarium]